MMHLLLERRDDLLALTDDLLVLGIVVHVKSLDCCVKVLFGDPVLEPKLIARLGHLDIH